MAAAPANPLERVPPHDEAAEIGVLGAMLLDERAAGIAAEMLRPDDFYVLAHQLLFEVFLALYARHPRLDTVEALSELRSRGLLEKAGGEDILDRLIEACPTASNVERYCRIVRDRSIERALLGAAREIAALCEQPHSEADGNASLLEQAEGLVFRIADQRAPRASEPIANALQGVMTDAERHMEARRQGKELPLPALPTGYYELDRILAGGLWPGEVVVIAARPSVGKTTLGVNIVRKMACRPAERNPIPCAIFSMEMPKEQVAKNILCAEAGVDSSAMRRFQFSEEDYQSVQDAARMLMRAPIFVDDTPALTTAELRARARRLYHRDGVRLLMIDYLQLMRTPRPRELREQEVAELSREVKQIARELSIPVLLLSQLRRPMQGKEGDRPNLTDLRESGAIEQDADVVLMLHRTLDAQTRLLTADTWAIVQKNRNGEIGDVRLSFICQHMRFEPYSPETAGGQGGAEGA